MLILYWNTQQQHSASPYYIIVVKKLKKHQKPTLNIYQKGSNNLIAKFLHLWCHFLTIYEPVQVYLHACLSLCLIRAYVDLTHGNVSPNDDNVSSGVSFRTASPMFIDIVDILFIG